MFKNEECYMKKNCVSKRILSGLICLTVVNSLSTSGIASYAEADTDTEYYSSLDPNSDTYQEWKSKFSVEQEVSPKKQLRSTVSSNSIKNDYLELVYNTENYSLGTIGGDPSISTDNNKRLLYGYPNKGTSYTTIRIDGQNYKFSPSSVSYTENLITASAVYDDINVTLNFSLIPNQYTGRNDVAEFSYSVKNMGATSHSVGVRIMFDTMLGDNDSSPFRIPNVGDTSSETDLSGNDVPEFWQSFDSIKSPKVIAQGTIKHNNSSDPDRIRFTNWNMATSNLWDYNRALGTSNGDSAVCIYWNPKNLSTGDVLNCTTHYGLSSMQQDGTPPLAVALTGATKLAVEHNENETESYNPNPFTVTAYIQNVGNGNAQDVTARINLPNDMSIVEGNETVDLGDLAVNSSSKQLSWKVWVEPSSISSIKSYSVTVEAANVEAKTLQRNIEVPALQTNGPLKLYFNRAKIDNAFNNLEIDFKLENSSNNNVDLRNYKARYYFVDENPDLKKEIEKYYCGSQNNSAVDVKVSYHSIPAPYKSSANAYLEFDFSTSNTILHENEHLRVYYAMHTKNWSSINVLNDFSALDNNFNGETGLILWTKMPIYEISSGKKVWGSEPKESSGNIAPTMTISCSANKTNNDSAVDMLISLKNTSSTPIYLSDSKLTYYYMNDNEYIQNVDINYVGGRINGDWVNITDKVSGRTELLETKKDRANSKISLSFSSIGGALCYNESLDIHLLLYNQNWNKGKFVLENDYSYDGITSSNNIASNIIFTASYLDSEGKNAKYQYGEPIGDYQPTFSAFKIGEGPSDQNTTEDYEIFISDFESNFNGVAYNQYATGENISSDDDFIFSNNNLYAILESDIAYISGHGSRGGAIPIYAHGIRPDYPYEDTESENYLCEMLYTQLLTTDININTDYQNFGLFEAENILNRNTLQMTPNRYYDKDSISQNDIFSLNMKDHLDDDINENLKWIITAACSQINDRSSENYGDDYPIESSCDRWCNVLINNKKMKGILGYWGRGPSANDKNPDNKIIREFLELSSPNNEKNYNIYDSWIKANEYFRIKPIKGTSPCGLIVKDNYDKERLYESLADNRDVDFEKIYRYIALNKNKISVDYEERELYKKAVESISSYYNLAYEDTIARLSDDFVEIDRVTYNLYGEEETQDVEEYLFSFVPVQNNRNMYAKKQGVELKGADNDIIIRYNPLNNEVEEFE